MASEDAYLQWWVRDVLTPVLLLLLAAYYKRDLLQQWLLRFVDWTWLQLVVNWSLHRHHQALITHKERFFRKALERVESCQMIKPKRTASILDIGFTHGTNLSFYPRDSGVSSVCLFGRTCSNAVTQQRAVGCAAAGIRVLGTQVLIDSSDASLRRAPLSRHSVVVADGYLCRVVDRKKALAVLYERLEPEGRLLILQHVAARTWFHPTRWVQSLLRPAYWYYPGGCDLTTTIHLKDLQEAGFHDISLDRVFISEMPVLDVVFRSYVFIICSRK